MTYRIIAVGADGTLTRNKRSWNSAKRESRSMIRELMPQGAKATKFTSTPWKSEDGLSFIGGFELWTISNGTEIKVEIKKL